jgi:hypothetical protein
MIGLSARKPKTKRVDLGKHGVFQVHPGLLHQHLGIAQGDPIPYDQKLPHEGDSPELAAERRSALGFHNMKHGTK